MPATALKGYEIQTTGSNAGTWGTVLNDSMIQYVDDNMAGLTTLSLSNANVTLSASQARMCMLRCAGTLTANVQVTSANNGFYLFENVTSGAFSVTLSDGTASVVLPQSRRGIVFRDATNGLRIVAIAGSASADPIPVGSVMLFYQSAAPAGWTIVNGLSDYALRLVESGAGGGTTSGSLAYGTVFGRTATDNHTLTVAEMPSHSHTYEQTTFSTSATGNSFSVGTGTSTTSTGNTGLGAGHSHAIDMRVRTVAVIMASKN